MPVINRPGRFFFKPRTIPIDAEPAVASNTESAKLAGIRTKNVLMASWGLAAAIGAVGGVAIAGAAVAVVATVFNQLAYSEGQRLASSSSLAAPADGAQLASIDSTVQTSWRVLTVASISAAALAVTAGVLAVFTDWQGLADEPPPATPTSTTTPPG